MSFPKIGILGGGQLGRMLIQSAQNLDLEIYILDPDPEAPCHRVATSFEVGALTDFDTVYRFGREMDIVSIEIEQVNTDALAKLAQEGVRVYPQPEIIRTIQDKRQQKLFYQKHQIPSADFILVENRVALQEHLDFLPAFQKLGSGGYDGRGVQLLSSEADLNKAFDAPSLLEKEVKIEKELAVIVARNVSGEVAIYPPVEMVFDPKLNLVDYLFAPADLEEALAEQARDLAKRVIEAFDMIGLLAIEMFLDQSGQLLVNEVAPRPHNSGHHTIEANLTSQYAQHLRAICNWKLGSTETLSLAAMVNLLGEPEHQGEAEYKGLEALLAIEGAFPHIYGKKITKPGRKMGHVTVLGKTKTDLEMKIQQIKQTVKVIAQ